MNYEEGKECFGISALKAPPTRSQAAEYIQELLGELIQMAKDAELPPVVAHLLEMAKLESDGLVR